MKMKYERPVMRAEMYQANNFIAACGENQSFSQMIGDVLRLSDIAGWFLPGAGNNQSDVTGDRVNTWNNLYGGLTFDRKDRLGMTNPQNKQQYYWHTTGKDGTRYYLEYSAGRTDRNRKDSFVLYKEETNDNELDINWLTFPGADRDTEGGLIDPLNWYDDAIAGVYFNQKVIQKS